MAARKRAASQIGTGSDHTRVLNMAHGSTIDATGLAARLGHTDEAPVAAPSAARP